MSPLAALMNGGCRPVDHAALGAMADVGPTPGTNIRIWTEGSFGLARSSPRIARGDSGTFPLMAGDVVLAWEGRLDNRCELRSLLQSNPEASGTDGDLVLALYRQRGLSCLEALSGDFALIVWDRRAQHLVAARDHLGVRPMHYATHQGSWYVASTLRQIRQAIGSTLDVNDATVGDFLIGRLDGAEDTFFDRVRRLAPGHLVEIGPDGAARQQAYWRPDFRRVLCYPRDSDYVDEFRELFIRSVENRLGEANAVGLLLSNGLDSNAIAATIGELAREKLPMVRPLTTVTAAFEDGTEPTGEHAPVARAYGFDSHVVQGDPAWTFSTEPEPLCSDEPLEGMYAVTLRRLLERAAERGVDVLLTGYAGDLVLGGTYYYLFELLTNRRWSAFLHELQCQPVRSRLRLLFKYVLGPAATRRPARTRYKVPTWVTPAFSRRLDLRSRARPAGAFESGIGVARQAEADGLGLVHHSTRMLWQHGEAEQLGMELRHPFLDRRLFEFLVALPSERKVRHGRAKTLLREMLDRAPAGPFMSRLPSVVPSKVFTRRVREREQHHWDACFKDSIAARSGYVDPHALHDAFARYLDGDTRLKYALARTFRLEAWLKRLRGRSCLRIEAARRKEGASHVGSATPGESQDPAQPTSADEARQTG